MRKLWILMSFLPALAFGAGEYDGIYKNKDETALNFASIHQNGDTLMVLGLYLDPGYWDVASGPITGDSANVELDYVSITAGEGAFGYNVLFHGDGDMTATLTTCNSELIPVCDDLLGSVLEFRKVF